jgi:hypothetical protein
MIFTKDTGKASVQTGVKSFSCDEEVCPCSGKTVRNEKDMRYLDGSMFSDRNDPKGKAKEPL